MIAIGKLGATIFAAAALGAVIASPAQALPYSFTDTDLYAGTTGSTAITVPVTLTGVQTFNYHHDLTDHVAAEDEILTALLTIVMTDIGGAENFAFSIEGQGSTSSGPIGNSDTTFTFDLSNLPIAGVSVLASLDLDKILNVSISLTQQGAQPPNVVLKSSVLSGRAEPAEVFVAVPEPGTMTLFGAALAGLALARRKRRTP